MIRSKFRVTNDTRVHTLSIPYETEKTTFHQSTFEHSTSFACLFTCQSAQNSRQSTNACHFSSIENTTRDQVDGRRWFQFGLDTVFFLRNSMPTFSKTVIFRQKHLVGDLIVCLCTGKTPETQILDLITIREANKIRRCIVELALDVGNAKN